MYVSMYTVIHCPRVSSDHAYSIMVVLVFIWPLNSCWDIRGEVGWAERIQIVVGGSRMLGAASTLPLWLKKMK